MTKKSGFLAAFALLLMMPLLLILPLTAIAGRGHGGAQAAAQPSPVKFSSVRAGPARFSSARFSFTQFSSVRLSPVKFAAAMSEDAIRKELIDIPLAGHYFDGRPWEETYFTDQRITYRDSTNRWTGKWSFRGAGFCTFYNEGRNGGCWQIVKISGNCYYFYALQRSGRPRLAKPGEGRRRWTARGWRKDQASSCDVEVGA